MPGSSMTNAAVTKQVTKQEGNTLTLKHKDGEQTIVVPPEVVVVSLIPGEMRPESLARRFSSRHGRRRREGTWEAAVVLVGRDGITPPMKSSC